ncbi:hypothetical protein AGMMS50276_18570 [Synergistales bacterium]|nr:hypothetical protein AGMMS50276_18570 [Synergistales bacterium]
MREPSAKLITGVLYPATVDFDWFGWVVSELEALWGVAEIISDSVPFNHTDYYHEIASSLLRRFICFGGMRGAGGLVDWKKEAIAIEAKSRSPRVVNIDPGYIDGARLVLASTKDHAHRVYVRDGIFAEVTMRYRNKKWAHFDYTFPDFASGVYDPFLTEARRLWMKEHNVNVIPPQKIV